MCGITGYFSFDGKSKRLESSLERAVKQLNKRGPDNQATIMQGSVGLGHSRLSILDTSASGNQPMLDTTGRYSLVFNGEIYNYKELKQQLGTKSYRSETDTEVLLNLLIDEGADGLHKLNGFFALAFHDKEEDVLLLARDQMGIKPLHYYSDKEDFFFGSELKALMAFPFERKLNEHSLYWYLKLNYLPGTLSMLEGVKKLSPGHFIKIDKKGIEIDSFKNTLDCPQSDYDQSQKTLVDLLDQSVEKRLMADVPLGSFLSGGTDSSAIVALASNHHSKLKTFSIGYSDNPFFDETYYAELVAEKFKTEHTTFKLTNDDLLADLDEILSYIDEPFADSSSIPTYILSKHVRNHVTVALSGDGADELFGGYYRHQALAKAMHPGFADRLVKWTNPLISMLPQSRSSKFGNLVRRLDKFGKLQSLSPIDRYWFLASLTNDPSYILSSSSTLHQAQFKKDFLNADPTINDYLIADQQLVLPGDMLTKVDLMSMANSLEVRVPFLDKTVVDFANSLPSEYKVGPKYRKRILQDAFKHILPEELYHRPKQGFEVPLLQWMRKELLSSLDDTLFNQDLIENQGLFRSEEVLALRKKLLSTNPGDVHGIIWALFVFQRWYGRYLDQ